MESNFDSSVSQLPQSLITDTQTMSSDLGVPKRKMWGLLLVGVLIGASVPYGVRYFQAAPLDIQDGLVTTHQEGSEKHVANFRKSLQVRMKAIFKNLQFSEKSSKDLAPTSSAHKTPKKVKKIAKSDKARVPETVLPSAPEGLPAALPVTPEISAPKAVSMEKVAVKASSTRKEKSVISVSEKKPTLPPSPPARATLASVSAAPKAKTTPLVSPQKISRPEPRSLVSERSLPVSPAKPKSNSYALVVNNARYSKDKLVACPKRCFIQASDANGNNIKVLIPGNLYAQGLQKHQGTINISGQPRLMKNQEVLVAESITFNLAPKSLAAKGSVQNPHFVPVLHKAPAKPIARPSGTDDDLVPGMVIESRKQIPQDPSDDFDGSDTRLEAIDP